MMRRENALIALFVVLIALIVGEAALDLWHHFVLHGRGALTP
jgi:hypothetical protein